MDPRFEVVDEAASVYGLAWDLSFFLSKTPLGIPLNQHSYVGSRVKCLLIC